MKYLKYAALFFVVGIIFCLWSKTFVLADVLLWLQDKETVRSCLAKFGPSADQRLAPFFIPSQMSYPPSKITLVVFKKTKILEVWAADKGQKYKFIRKYPILATSGALGPKLLEGDMQVPEGIYHISYLNPNSMFHLSLKLNYPNDFDEKMARQEGRQDLGSDIMIHGGAQSIGCIAIGDQAIEDIFVLVAKTGLRNVKVIITPIDFRTGEDLEIPSQMPQWVTNLYANIRSELITLTNF